MAVNKGGTAESFGPFSFRDCKALFILCNRAKKGDATWQKKRN